MASNKFEYNLGGLAFMGCVLAGIGIGIFIEDRAAGALVGAGVGLVAMFLIIKFKIK